MSTYSELSSSGFLMTIPELGGSPAAFFASIVVAGSRDQYSEPIELHAVGGSSSGFAKIAPPVTRR